MSVQKENHINFLYSLEKFGIKLGLENTHKLLKEFNNPQSNYKTIHIAGTNGKGSTSAYIVSILIESGYSVGHYTSPHLIRFNERIKINNQEIQDEEINSYIERLKDSIIKYRATFFESTTAIAFQYFSDKMVDFAVIETGLGGRYDSTNVLYPILSVITSISIDHVEQLGNTIESITYEKAGIIKDKIPCITGVLDKASLNIITDIANQKNSEVYNVNDLYKVSNIKILPDGLSFDVEDKDSTYNISSPLNGKHQINNILCSIQTAKLLQLSGYNKISRDSILNGIKNVVKNTGLRCRIETYSKKPYIILDVAHNVDSIKSLINTINFFDKNKIYLIFGIMKDKDYNEIVNLLSNIINKVYCVAPKTERALDPKIISDLFRMRGKISIVFESVEKAVENAISKLDEDEILLITGSHYICGEALDYLEKKCLDKISKKNYI